MTDPPPHPDLPPSLRGELRELYRPPGAMPPARDAAILAAARQAYLAHKFRRRRLVFATAGSLAAAVALAAMLWSVFPRRPAPSVALAYTPTGDIRDAFFLARHLRATTAPGVSAMGMAPLGSDWDINHDGRVDEQDVQALAVVAVRLDRGATP